MPGGWQPAGITGGNPGMLRAMPWQRGRRHHTDAGDAVQRGWHAWASQPGKSWNDAGDAVAKGPGWQPAGITPGKSIPNL